MGYDLVVRNGTVVDGSGLARYRADVGVVGDTIATVGRITETGDHEIDADGLVVSPGFVDGHTHMDTDVLRLEPLLHEFTRFGVQHPRQDL